MESLKKVNVKTLQMCTASYKDLEKIYRFFFETCILYPKACIHHLGILRHCLGTIESVMYKMHNDKRT